MEYCLRWGVVGSQNPLVEACSALRPCRLSRKLNPAGSEFGDSLERLWEPKASVVESQIGFSRFRAITRRRAKSIDDEDLRAWHWRPLSPSQKAVVDRALVGRIFPERIMNPIILVIGDVFSQEPA